jgi:hypothetical protein
MKAMKRLAIFLLCSGALSMAAELSGVHSVYVMPMAKGLDQYLANKLTNHAVFQVVTDAKLADAVLTDRLGEGFESQFATMLPPDPAKTESEADAPKEAEDVKDADGVKDKDAKPAKDVKQKDAKDPHSTSLLTETANKLSNPASNSSFGRAKGTIFLVDKESRRVLWSVYQPAKGPSSRQLDRTASDIVSRLKHDLTKKSK